MGHFALFPASFFRGGRAGRPGPLTVVWTAGVGAARIPGMRFPAGRVMR